MGPYQDATYYGHDFIGEKESNELLEWLSERKDQVFDFRKEMLEYCRSDEDILRQACLKFRELLMSATGVKRQVINDKGKKEMKWFGAVDPFDSVIIVSVCMNWFRKKSIEEEWSQIGRQTRVDSCQFDELETVRFTRQQMDPRNRTHG